MRFLKSKQYKVISVDQISGHTHTAQHIFDSKYVAEAFAMGRCVQSNNKKIYYVEEV